MNYKDTEMSKISGGFCNRKIQVNSPAHSKAIQEFLFSRGHSWLDGKYIQYTNAKYLFIDNSGELSYTSDDSYTQEDNRCWLELDYLDPSWNQKVKNKSCMNFKKEDLKTGMLVRTRDGDLRLILGNTAISLKDCGGVGLKRLTTDLLDEHNNTYDIVEVYSEPNNKEDDFLGAGMSWWAENDRFLKYSKLLWKREGVVEVEMTMSEICKALGKQIKVIKG